MNAYLGVNLMSKENIIEIDDSELEDAYDAFMESKPPDEEDDEQ